MTRFARTPLGVLIVLLAVGFLLQLWRAPMDAVAQPVGDADALRLQIARELADEMRPPVGTVLAFWGSRAEVEAMKTYELCDGSPVHTTGSPLFGKNKPNLLDRFIMGNSGSEDLRENSVVGGTNHIPARPQGNTAECVLTVAQMPSHSHPHGHYVAVVQEVGNSYLGDHRTQTIVTSGQSGADSKYALNGSGAGANAGRTNEDKTETGGGQGHAHALPDIPPHDNRPAFSALYYIIRVK